MCVSLHEFHRKMLCAAEHSRKFPLTLSNHTQTLEPVRKRETRKKDFYIKRWYAQIPEGAWKPKDESLDLLLHSQSAKIFYFNSLLIPTLLFFTLLHDVPYLWSIVLNNNTFIFSKRNLLWPFNKTCLLILVFDQQSALSSYIFKWI